jgi:aminoglycoside phosphotransferase (APT) family kinase protein
VALLPKNCNMGDYQDVIDQTATVEEARQSEEQARQRDVQALGMHLYGVVPSLRKCYSEMNHVYLLDFGGALPDRVLKLAGAEWARHAVGREGSIVRRMHELGLPVPEVEYTQDDVPGAATPFLAMVRVPGHDMPTYPWDMSAASTRDAWRSAGAALARIHAVPAAAVPGVRTADQYLGYERERHGHLCAFSASQGLADVTTDLLRRVAAHLADDTIALVNADLTPFEFITDGVAVTIVDWTAAAAGFPMRDLGQFRAWVRAMAGAEQLMAWFLDGYFGGLPGPDVLQEIRDWEAYDKLGYAMFYHNAGRTDAAAEQLHGVRASLDIP